MPDPAVGALTALRRLRHVETDAARRELGEALTRETALAARQSALGQEIEAARRTSGEFNREAFVAWFGRVRAERERLTGAMQQAETLTAEARTTLAHRRVAETAAEDALAEARTAQRAATDQRAQVMLEDVARLLRRTPR